MLRKVAKANQTVSEQCPIAGRYGACVYRIDYSKSDHQSWVTLSSQYLPKIFQWPFSTLKEYHSLTHGSCKVLIDGYGVRLI